MSNSYCCAELAQYKTLCRESLHMPDFVKSGELYTLMGLVKSILAPDYTALYANRPEI